MIIETQEIIQLKREQFRCKMRKQLLEKGLKEKRLINLKILQLKDSREDSIDDLNNALQNENQQEIVDILNFILDDDVNSQSNLANAYQSGIHLLIFQYLKKNNLVNQVNLYFQVKLIHRLLIFLNDMFYNFPSLFHDILESHKQEKQQSKQSVLDLLSNFIDTDDNDIMSISLTIIGNLIQEDEQDVIFLIRNFNLFKKIAQRYLDDELLQSELFFINTLASMLKRNNPNKEDMNIGLYIIIICDLSQNKMEQTQLTKFYKSFAIILEYSNKKEIDLVTQIYQFPTLLNQILQELNQQQEVLNYAKFYVLKTLRKLVILLDPAWINIMFDNGLEKVLISQLKSNPKSQRQTLKLIKFLASNKYAQQLIFLETNEFIQLLISIFQERSQALILQIFTNVVVGSFFPEIADKLVKEKIFDLYNFLIDLQPKITIDMLLSLINIQQYDKWNKQVKKQMKEITLFGKLTKLQYHENTEISLNSQAIIQTLSE